MPSSDRPAPLNIHNYLHLTVSFSFQQSVDTEIHPQHVLVHKVHIVSALNLKHFKSFMFRTFNYCKPENVDGKFSFSFSSYFCKSFEIYFIRFYNGQWCESAMVFRVENQHIKTQTGADITHATCITRHLSRNIWSARGAGSIFFVWSRQSSDSGSTFTRRQRLPHPTYESPLTAFSSSFFYWRNG